MKVCFISPPTVIEFRESDVTEPEASRLIFERAPSGILTLASVLNREGAEVEIVDLNRLYNNYLNQSPKPDRSEFCEYAGASLRTVTADVFGFGTICGSYPLTLRLARLVAESHHDTPIILGGPQASVVDVPTLESFPFVDLIVRGEAEETLPRVLDAISHNAALAQIAGITYRSGCEVVRNPNAPVIEDLDSLPLPAYHLYSNIENSNYAPLEAGRGCPFACSFCSTNDFFRRQFRMKSPHILVDQMKTVKDRYGINEFDLIHDMFTVDRKKVVSFCEEIRRSGENLRWGCSARTDCIDDKLIDLMADNGCTGIFFGIDSGSDRMQTIMHKRLNLAEAALRIRRANRRRIRHTVSLITGYPEERKEDLRQSIKFIGESLRHPFAEIQLHLLAPLAETPITSQYQDRLVFDDIFSDISFHGWDQHQEERAMIMEYPKIFPNFYGIPTRWLTRHYLREVREFLLHGILKVRWLMVLLHRDSGDLLRVFDQWASWSLEARNVNGNVDSRRAYYAGDKFPQDLSEFLRSNYVKTATYPHLIKAMADVEAAQYKFKDSGSNAKARQKAFDSLGFVPVAANGTHILQVRANYKRLMRALKRNERLESIPVEEVTLALVKRNDRVRVVQLSHVSSELIGLCDGKRSVKQVAVKFSAAKTLDVSPLKASIYGLASLAEQGFIDFIQN